MRNVINSLYDSVNPPSWVTKAALGLVCVTGVGYAVYRIRRSGITDSGTISKPIAGTIPKRTTDSVQSSDLNTMNTVQRRPKPIRAQRPESIYEPYSDETDEMSTIEVATSLKNTGNSLFQRKKFDDAVAAYTQALLILPDNESTLRPLLYQNRGAAYDVMGKLQNAHYDLTCAIRLDLRYAKARMRRARVCERLELYRQAAEDWIVVGVIEEFRNHNTIMQADRLLQKVGEVEAKRNFLALRPVVPAPRIYRNCLHSYCCDPIMTSLNVAEDKDELRILNSLKFLIKQENFRDVERLCDEYIRENEMPSQDNFDVWQQVILLRGTLHFCCVDLQQAKTCFNRLLAVTPMRPRTRLDIDVLVATHVRRANIWLQMQEIEKFEQDLLAALALDSKNADIYHQRGQFYLMLNQLDAALNDFKEAHRLTGKQNYIVAAHLYFTSFRLGLLSNNEDRTKRAQQSLLDISERCHISCEPETLLALTYMETKTYDRAEEYLLKAEKKDPTDGTIHVHRGLTQLQAYGNVDLAVTYLEQATLVDPTLELAFETLATVEIQRGNLVRALELFEKACSLTHSENEMAHVIALKAAAEVQLSVAQELHLPNLNDFAAFRQARNQI